MSYIDCIHVCNTFLVSNNKNIFKVKETLDKKLCSLVLRNMKNNCNTCQDPDKVIFNLSSYNSSDHENIVISKGLSFAIPRKPLHIQNFWYPFQCYLEILTAWSFVVLIKNVLKVDFEIVLTSFKQVSKISEKNLLN